MKFTFTPLVRLLTVLAIAVAALAIWQTARSESRTSASYKITVEAATNSGGNAASASYQQPDFAAGQDISGGAATSASYKEQGGIVQFWGGPPTSVPAWQDHE